MNKIDSNFYKNIMKEIDDIKKTRTFLNKLNSTELFGNLMKFLTHIVKEEIDFVIKGKI